MADGRFFTCVEAPKKGKETLYDLDSFNIGRSDQFEYDGTGHMTSEVARSEGPVDYVPEDSGKSYFVSLQLGPRVNAIGPVNGKEMTNLRGRMGVRKQEVVVDSNGKSVLSRVGPYVTATSPENPFVCVYAPLRVTMGPLSPQATNGWIAASNRWLSAHTKASSQSWASADDKAVGSLQRQILVTGIAESDEEPADKARGYRLGSRQWVIDFTERLGQSMADSIGKAIAKLSKK